MFVAVARISAWRDGPPPHTCVCVRVRVCVYACVGMCIRACVRGYAPQAVIDAMYQEPERKVAKAKL